MNYRQAAARWTLLLLAAVQIDASAATPWHCEQTGSGSWNCNPPAATTPSTDAFPAARKEQLPATPAAPVTATTRLPTTPVAAATDETPVATAATPAPATAPVPPTTQDKADRWALCPPVAPESVFDTEDADLDVIDLRADTAAASPDRVFTLSGDAIFRYGEYQLQANDITFRQERGEVEASNGIRFAGPELVVSGESALLQTEQERGTLKQITYALPGQHARGGASLLSLEGAYHQRLEKASYTTCPPGSQDWMLSAREVELDHAEGTGVARNAKITFKQVPILYTPYISFPLDERRKTGLLLPKVGTTEETGVDISLPWYWNIAPNRDATITPRLMSDRGVMLGGEFRYLTRHSEGSINAEYLPSDDEFGGQDRSLVSLRHYGTPTARLETSITASDASDSDYFEDLGNDLVQTSQTSLERTARATYHGQDWKLGIVVQDFQNLDSTLASADRPYRQLPQILFDFSPDRRVLGIKTTAQAEVNYFSHSDNSVVKGTRLDVQPRFSLPVRRAGWYVEPTVGVRHTAYTLDNTAPGIDTDPARTTPVVSLDAGSFFERSGSWGNRPYIQTLEPRLFYLYVPEKDQQDLPVFDTGNYDFNFWTLFRENRFNGPDRMGDANQLALALTTRFLNPASGQQLLSASLGSLLYFRDRTVTLPGETVDLDNSSDLIGELDLSLSRFWSVRAEMLWDPRESHTERNNYRLQYRRGPRQLINLGYRFRDNIQEQADVSFLWPLSRTWHAVGRWYVDLDSNETIEALAGLAYESCCWGVQLLGRSYVNSDGVDRTTAIFLQLELKGLGKLGTSVDDALERGILGYRSNN
jgi:LPS-assembly protein